MPRNKVVDNARDVIAQVVEDGMTIAVGGFGLCGVPFMLIDALCDIGRKELTIVSNNMGTDRQGLGRLLENRQVSKVIASYVGENKEFARQYLDKEIEVEFTPQGTLAERLRAGGAGIPAFYTATGVGTDVAEGKPREIFDGREYVQERAIVADVALIHAWKADTGGNLVYRRTARNFNPVCAESGVVTVAEAESIVSLGVVDPDHVVTSGVHVNYLLQTPADAVKPIEQVTTRANNEA